MDAKLGGAVVKAFNEDGEEVMVTAPTVILTFSERNLRTLLLSLDDPNGQIVRMTEDNILLVIQAESNDVHYKDRPAGLMQEDIELKLAAEELGLEDEPLFVPESFGKSLDD